MSEESRRILVVDDDVDIATSMARLLSHLGYDARSVNDGPAALQEVEEFWPDVAFLDISLPGMDGFELARALRERQNSQNLVLIALTGYGGDEHRERSLQNGFDHHLVKPISLAELKKFLDQTH